MCCLLYILSDFGVSAGEAGLVSRRWLITGFSAAAVRLLASPALSGQDLQPSSFHLSPSQTKLAGKCCNVDRSDTACLFVSRRLRAIGQDLFRLIVWLYKS